MLSKALQLIGLLLIPSLSDAGPAAAHSVVQDWSTHHAVFSHPGHEPHPSDKAAHERWSKIVAEPRFRMQAERFFLAEHVRATRRHRVGDLHRDWSMETAPAPSTTPYPNEVTGFPAKFSFSSTTASCDNAAVPDFVVFMTGQSGNNVVAYDNLYSGCTGPAPLVYFQYDTQSTGGGNLSLSLDGSQLAFNDVDSSGHGRIVLLKWAKNTSTVVQPTAVAATAYRNCTAPCMTLLAPSTAVSNMTSPYVDYNTDTIYAGDSTGNVHQITGAFLGTPTLDPSGWPVNIDTKQPSAALVDPVSGYVIFGTQSGYVVRIPPSGGSAVVSAHVQTICGLKNAGTADFTAGYLYIVAVDTAASGSCTSTGAPPGLVQISTTFTAGATPTVVALTGVTATSSNNTSPTFDNAYFNSSNPLSPSGRLFVCISKPATIAQFNILNNSITAAAAPTTVAVTTNLSPTTAAPAPTCSYISENYDGVSDRIFVGIGTGSVSTAGTYDCGGVSTAIGAGCALEYDITSANISSSSTPAANLPIAGGGAGAMIVDTNASLTGARQVYFSTYTPQACAGNSAGAGAGTGYCAIQASQSGLN